MSHTLNRRLLISHGPRIHPSAPDDMAASSRGGCLNRELVARETFSKIEFSFLVRW